MTGSGKKTLEEHCEFVAQIARVSYFYAWNIRHHFPEQSLSDILMFHTPLYHDVLGLNVGTAHEKLLACPAENTEEFEEKMFCRTKDFLMERASLLYPVSEGVYMPPEYNCGSLKYDPPNPALPQGWCIFHIRNATAPYSIFTDMKYLLECFEKLMNDSEEKYKYKVLYTHSWLNDRSDWLALFPEEWRDNLSERNESVIPGWDLGAWGQLINARGTFNYGAGDFIRKTGHLKYIPRSSHCSFSAMRQKLKPKKKATHENSL